MGMRKLKVAQQNRTKRNGRNQFECRSERTNERKKRKSPAKMYKKAASQTIDHQPAVMSQPSTSYTRSRSPHIPHLHFKTQFIFFSIIVLAFNFLILLFTPFPAFRRVAYGQEDLRWWRAEDTGRSLMYRSPSAAQGKRIGRTWPGNREDTIYEKEIEKRQRGVQLIQK